MFKMDKPITINNVIDNLEVVSSSMSSIYRSGTFEKFTDKEKDMFNRMKILLDNTIYTDWIITK